MGCSIFRPMPPFTAFSGNHSSYRKDDLADRFISRLGSAIEAAFILLLAFLPLCFGGVQAWAEEAAFVLTALIALLFLARCALSRHSRWSFTWAFVPVALFLLLAIFQLLPLPHALA